MKNTSTLKKVLNRIKKYLPLLSLSLILALISVALTLYLPIVFGNAIDLITSAGNVDFNAILPLLVTAAIVIGLTAAAQWVMNYCNNKIAYNVIKDLRNEAFEKLQKLPFSYLDTHSSGDIVSRIISDADQFADGLLLGFTQFFTGIMTIIGTILFMLSINVKITLVVVLITPLSLFVAKLIASKTYSMFKAQSSVRGEQTAFIDEMINNQKLVVAFNHTDKNMEKFNEINDRLEKCSLRAVFFSSTTNPSTRFINNLVYAAVALVGALSVIGGSLTVGNLSALLSYANQYTKPFNEISGVITELQNSIACAARLFELIEAEPESSDKGYDKLTSVKGEVSAKNVSFSYVPEKKLIENFNIDVKPGQRVAIVGPTGCGKTTIINLLMRFYDVNGGKITVDGKDIREVTRHSLRSSYGMVLQETWLRAGTIRDNIILGKPDATDEEIIAAARAAHSHSFIKRLPDGYDTVIGEDGGSLSQGQKQLLCITRIMLAPPPMLILDEATSSIDTRTEIRIQKAFAKLMEGRTSFIVAHRLSTIKEADVILVMKDGNVIEKGSHEELLAAGGFYTSLYNSQFAG